MDLVLTAEQARVLGCLLEKKMATPEYYPLSLNSLMNAANQKVNREPVVAYDESVVLGAIQELRSKGLVWINTSGRVDKYKEALVESLELSQDQAAVLCILLLRGPQTAGEIRGRSERLFCFADLDAVHASLESLAAKGWVEPCARQPGQKEQRFFHTLGDSRPGPSSAVVDMAAVHSNDAAASDRVSQLEQQVADLAGELYAVKQAFEAFRQQFEA